jgi:hypothetical protein
MSGIIAKKVVATEGALGLVIRGAQLLLTVVCLGVTGAAIPDWHNLDCNVPIRVIVNMAIVCLLCIISSSFSDLII